MKTTTKTTTGLKVTSAIKAGSTTVLLPNHSRAGLKVKSAVRAGGLNNTNHSRTGLRIKTAIKAGNGLPLQSNHNRRVLP
jgi:hypothetical protein